MRTMSCVLAFATLMATMWIRTVAVDLDEELHIFLETMYAGDKIPAHLINVDRVAGAMYEKADQSNNNVVDLLLKETPEISQEAQPHEFCGYHLGIQVNNAEYACSPRSISLEIYKDNGNENKMRFIVQFQASQEESLVKLYIPVLEIPPQYLDPATLWQWAKVMQVEIITPLKPKELILISTGMRMPVYFGWLDRLVSAGLYRAKRPNSKEFSAWTRPLVVRSQFINEFVKVWNQFKGTEIVGTSSS